MCCNCTGTTLKLHRPSSRRCALLLTYSSSFAHCQRLARTLTVAQPAHRLHGVDGGGRQEAQREDGEEQRRVRQAVGAKQELRRLHRSAAQLDLQAEKLSRQAASLIMLTTKQNGPFRHTEHTAEHAANMPPAAGGSAGRRQLQTLELIVAHGAHVADMVVQMSLGMLGSLQTSAKCDAHRIGREAKEARGAGADHSLQAVEGGVAAAAVVAVRIALRHCRHTNATQVMSQVRRQQHACTPGACMHWRERHAFTHPGFSK
jgi:hypothetical protein